MNETISEVSWITRSETKGLELLLRKVLPTGKEDGETASWSPEQARTRSPDGLGTPQFLAYSFPHAYLAL